MTLAGEHTAAELKIMDAVATGELVVLHYDGEINHYTAEQAANEAKCQVRAELLIDLLTTDQPTTPRRALRLRGASITGELDLQGCELPCPLILEHSWFTEPVVLNDATAPSVSFSGCHVPGFYANRLHSFGDLTLDDWFTTTTGISLTDAHIEGRLLLTEAHTSWSKYFSSDTTAWAPPAISADGITVDRDFLAFGFRRRFTADGPIRLSGAKIGGTLDLHMADLDGRGGHALVADNLTVGQDAYLSDAGIKGQISLRGASIGGEFLLDHTSFASRDSSALEARHLIVGQDMSFLESACEGEISLSAARIGGDLSFSGACLRNQGKVALNAERIDIGHTLTFEDGFTAHGDVRLRGARISSHTSFNAAQMVNRGSTALNADSITTSSLIFRETHMEGQACLNGAKVDSHLNFDTVTLSNPHGVTLSLRNAEITSLSVLLSNPPDAAIDLTGAHVGAYADDLKTWPKMIYLHGFTYETLENSKVSVRDRLRWLGRHPGGYIPQLYDQLASCYQRAGRDEAARRVAIAKQRHRRNIFSPLNWLWYITVGYGYRTWLAALWLLGLIVVGTLVFAHAYPGHFIQTPEHVEKFSAFGYTLDVLLPIVDLAEKSSWTPLGYAMYWTWGLTLAGWTLVTAVVAGLTPILKRD